MKVDFEQYLRKAEAIVKSYKPTDPALQGFEPVMKLSIAHHQELNGMGVAEGRYAELRVEYAGDAFALEQIDIYDQESAYSAQKRLYIEALKSDDTDKQAVLEAWFRENYPLTDKTT